MFRAPPETRQVLDKLTMQTIKVALARKKPTVDYEEITDRYYYAFYRKNEAIKRHIRKFKQRYWAANNADNLPLPSDSSSDVDEAALGQLEVQIDIKDRRLDSRQNSGMLPPPRAQSIEMPQLQLKVCNDYKPDTDRSNAPKVMDFIPPSVEREEEPTGGTTKYKVIDFIDDDYE